MCIRELSRGEEALSEDLRRHANQLWSYLQRRFPAVLHLCPGADEARVWDLLRRCRALPSRAARLSPGVVRELLRRQPGILCSFPGFERICIATVLAEAFPLSAERNYRALRALCGVAPVTKQSGKTRIVSMLRACHNPLRNTMFHAAQAHCDSESAAQQLYARLRGAPVHAPFVV